MEVDLKVGRKRKVDPDMPTFWEQKVEQLGEEIEEKIIPLRETEIKDIRELRFIQEISEAWDRYLFGI
jgi:hypothetical protein